MKTTHDRHLSTGVLAIWFSLAATTIFLVSVVHAQTVTQRSTVLQAMQIRPSDPWPRGTGHVIYAIPGSIDEQKGYEEPGGSFSPAVSSFGVSIWVLDPKSGAPVRTSDSIPLSSLSQKYLWTAPEKVPDLEVTTPDYTATWRVIANGSYTLTIKPKGNKHLALCVRSVGPAGGPIDQLVWKDHLLAVNNLWKLHASSASLFALGHEGNSGWTTLRNDETRWQGNDGWGYALLDLRPRTRSTLTISGSELKAYPDLRTTGTTSGLTAQLPDPRFMQSLNSQVANLMMGLVDHQTRPGDPTNYPLAWLRDGAYTVVGLARAGQLETAKELALYFAKHDFFGGFGPEADSPGLSLWTIETVANLADDPTFDRTVWPDIERKAAFIIAMRHASAPIYEEPFGPIVPAHAHGKDLRLVCDPAQNGLIMGRMDWHRPVLFINAVSYLGLEDAADIANRLGHSEQAKRWQAEAAETQIAWQRAFETPERDNDRTYISTLWPTWVGTNVESEYMSLIAARWNKTHNTNGEYKQKPLWTYFDVAEAHQWLYLDDPSRTWLTLNWFWQHQSSPGLYTWWEGNGEENSFGRWQNVRGWVHPPNVTPHYWTAAEMLLLQIDMLAYADRGNIEPVIIVGAGIPKSWIHSNMSVRSVPTEFGLVDWNWNHGKLSVTVHGSHAKVRPGASFGRSPMMSLHYQ